MSGAKFSDVFSTTWKVILSLLLISLGITFIYFLIATLSATPASGPASGGTYLFAAYAVTWIIHIVYLSTIVSRYARLKREIDELKK